MIVLGPNALGRDRSLHGDREGSMPSHIIDRLHAENVFEVAGGRNPDGSGDAKVNLSGPAAAAPGGGDDQPDAVEPPPPVVAGGGGNWWDELNSFAGQAIDAFSAAAGDFLDSSARGLEKLGLNVLVKAEEYGLFDEDFWSVVDTFATKIVEGGENIGSGIKELFLPLVDIYGELVTIAYALTGADEAARNSPLLRGYLTLFTLGIDFTQRWDPISAAAKYTNERMVFGGDSIGEIFADTWVDAGLNGLTLGWYGYVQGAIHYAQTGDPKAWQQASGANFAMSVGASLAGPDGIITPRHAQPIGSVAEMGLPEGGTIRSGGRPGPAPSTALSQFWPQAVRHHKVAPICCIRCFRYAPLHAASAGCGGV